MNLEEITAKAIEKAEIVLYCSLCKEQVMKGNLERHYIGVHLSTYSPWDYIENHLAVNPKAVRNALHDFALELTKEIKVESVKIYREHPSHWLDDILNLQLLKDAIKE